MLMVTGPPGANGIPGHNGYNGRDGPGQAGPPGPAGAKGDVGAPGTCPQCTRKLMFVSRRKDRVTYISYKYTGHW